MANVKDIFEYLDSRAPCSYKMDFDNVGLLIGHEDMAVDKLLIALDITDEVIKEAIDIKANLIVSHHPIFFSLKSISSETPQGNKALSMIENNIAAICMHTNLDAANGGVNDALAKAAGLTDIRLLEVIGEDKDGNSYGIGRIGTLSEEKNLNSYLLYLKGALKSNGLRYYDAGKPVKLVAVGGGSCGDYLNLAVENGCDTFITSDIKYDSFLEAKRMGINIIDGDHYCTENVVVTVLQKWLEEVFPSVDSSISEVHVQTAKFI